MKKLRVHVYVDGFNLYNGSLKRNPECKWLNIFALCKCLLNQEYEIRTVHFFTAKVHGKRDQDQPNRQEIYFRALRTVPQVQNS